MRGPAPSSFRPLHPPESESPGGGEGSLPLWDYGGQNGDPTRISHVPGAPPIYQACQAIFQSVALSISICLERFPPGLASSRMSPARKGLGWPPRLHPPPPSCTHHLFPFLHPNMGAQEVLCDVRIPLPPRLRLLLGDARMETLFGS